MNEMQTVSIEDRRTDFVEKAIAAMRDIEYRRIENADELEKVFRLRYDAYRREGLISENAFKMSIDKYDMTENAAIFGLYYLGELASSIRIHFATPERPVCPTVSHFPNSLDRHFGEGKTFIDSSRFCANLEMGRRIQMLPLLTTRLSAMAALYFRADYTLSVVKPEHGAFYRRFWGMERWGDSQKVDWFAVPVDLYAGDVQRVGESVTKKFPFLNSTQGERLRLFAAADQDNQAYSCIQRTDRLRQAVI